MVNDLVISNIKGGFGNQLFQFATGYAVAKKYNVEFKLDLSFYDSNEYRKFYRLNHIKHAVNIATPQEIKKIKKYSHTKIMDYLKTKLKYGHFQGVILDSPSYCPSVKVIKAKPPVYIEGWCTKLEYFHHMRSDLIKIFVFEELIGGVLEGLLREIKHTESVFIHLRRGDYLQNKVLKTLELDYYRSAICFFKSQIINPTFFVFSDDIKWVKENLKIPELHFVQHTCGDQFQSDLIEFQLMLSCKHAIIANSSFSWWAAYLIANETSLVVSPAIWHKDEFYRGSFAKYPFIPKTWNII